MRLTWPSEHGGKLRLGTIPGRLRSITGILLGMLVGQALGAYLVLDPGEEIRAARLEPGSSYGPPGLAAPISFAEVAWLLLSTTNRWPIVLLSLAGGLFGAGCSVVLSRRVHLRLCVLGVLVIAGCLIWTHVSLPHRCTRQFHRAIRAADRLVIRHGGFDCCGPVDNQRILFEVVDPAEVAQVRQHLQFRGFPSTGCGCCGYPGMDWYCGDTRVAHTSVQHWGGIRWRQFKGDAHLTEEASRWLQQWLNAHGITSDAPGQF